MPIAFLIAGLGNPGSKYTHTRHNAGFMAIERLVDLEPSRIEPIRRDRDEATCWRWEPEADLHCILAQPQTYMNVSGRSVRKMCRRYGLSCSQLLVIHDEIDLPLGRLRLKFGGGLAGHNGLRSIAAELGSRDFYRLRIGVGRPEPGQDVIKHVLSPFFPSERNLLDQTLQKAAEAIRTVCTQGFQTGMQALHTWQATSRA